MNDREAVVVLCMHKQVQLSRRFNLAKCAITAAVSTYHAH